ncbi:MAG: hypothetical protein JW785_02520 [Acidimicrobiia bacterium]|nr:hypothetical protein [Acidimicrobiia bacterium]
MAAFRAWGRYALGAAASIAIGVVAFGMKQPVPALDLFDLAVHELGHLVTALMPRMIMFLAGSVFQVAVPVGLAAYFLFRRREWASSGFCLAWAGTSARDVAVYVADAPVQALPLIGGGTHDWAYLLGPQGFDCIEKAGAIARSVEVLGLLMVIAGTGICLWPLVGWRSAARRAPVVAPVRARLVRPPVDTSGDPWLVGAGRGAAPPGTEVLTPPVRGAGEERGAGPDG